MQSPASPSPPPRPRPDGTPGSPALSKVASPRAASGPAPPPGGRGGGKLFVKRPAIPALPQPVAAPPVPALPPAVLPRPARAEPGLRPESLAGPVRPVSTKISPRAMLTLGGSLLAQYPTAWRAQGGLAKELAAVLDQVRESHPVIARPSLSRVDDLVQRYDLGTELARFHLRVDEVIATLHAELPRDLLRGQLDALSESAWWLLQAYSREELRTVPVAGTALVAPLESKASEGEDDSDSADEVVLGPQSPKLADQSADPTPPDSVALLAKAKQSYIRSTNVLETLEGRLMVHLETLRSSLASTTDSAHWLSLVCSGPKSAMLLLRELELGANDPTTRDLGTRLFHAVEATFDQYTGLRQIADFRGLPDAPFELSEAIQLIGRIYEHTLATGLQTLENLELVDEMRLSQAFENTCEELLKEYKAFKAGLLTRLGYMSSLHEQEGGRNLNSTIVLDYVRQVMQICDLTVEEMTGSFNERVQQITFMSAAKQMEIYSAMGGRQELGQRVRAHLFQVKPWARESIQLQTESLLQREVFGKSRADIMSTLSASKDQMLAGFKALTDGRIPEPLNRMDEIITHMDAQIEAILGPASSRKMGLFGKTARGAGKSSRGRKKKDGAQGAGVALSGMTIRGNKFTEADMESFAPPPVGK